MRATPFLPEGIRRTLALTLAGAAMVTLLAGCGKESAEGAVHHHRQEAAETTETTVVTEPAPTIPADGNPEDVTCKGTYTVDGFDSSAVVATIEDQQLTNGGLNLLYRLQINQAKADPGENGPDFTQDLDTQICQIAETPMTWQQYYLQKAIDSWQGFQSLERRSHEVMIQNELNFAVNQEKHDEYMANMPINDTVLYGAEIRFKLSKQEQAFMDSLPDMLSALAESKGYGSVQEMAAGEFGSSEEDLTKLVNLMNYSYMYFIRNSYDPVPTEEELNAQLSLLESSDEKTVDLRHILVYSDDAGTTADGKLEGDDAVWNDSYSQAEYLLKKFRGGKKQSETDFAVLAHDYTRDEGSRLDGGFYGNVHRGQLPEALENWFFDPARQPGDTDLVQSDYGWHVVYFCGSKDARTEEAETNFRREKMGLILEEAKYNYPMTITYGNIELAPVDLENLGTVTIEQDLLYPDVAHERFDEVPVYIQQDYEQAPYGSYKVSSHGCGISALAMLSTYMADEPLTPAILADRYGRYNGLHGTDMRMFLEVPPELGYYVYKRSGVWNEVEENLHQGRMTISLQVKGYFTRGGHYLVLSEMTEDGRVVIRDSNIYNYKRLPEHAEDCFPPKKLLPNCKGFWIYDNKFTHSPSCSRCGNPTAEYMPRVVGEDYICRKCVPAMERRQVFLDLCRAH